MLAVRLLPAPRGPLLRTSARCTLRRACVSMAAAGAPKQVAAWSAATALRRLALAGGRKEVVQTDKAPAAVGPYSQVCRSTACSVPSALNTPRFPGAQGVKSNGMLYMSGSIGLVPQARHTHAVLFLHKH